jgi:hypothetical protein
MPALFTTQVDAAEVVDGCLDDALGALRVGDAVAVGHGDAAGLLDLGHHLIGDLDVGALALGRAAEIVDHHLGALRRRRAARSPRRCPAPRP